MKIKFKKLHKDAEFPRQATELAGGWDVKCTKIEQVSDDFVICKLGFALEIPKGYRLILVPRSSFTKYKWILQNSPGLGDADYLGEYQFRFRAIPSRLNCYNIDIPEENIIYSNELEDSVELYYQEFPYKVGDRIGQVYLEEVIPMEFEEVDKLSDTSRGSGGYGSTGN